MDAQRAQEIAASPVMAHVTHNGAQVYIQRVNEQDGTASIYHLEQPEIQQEVPVHSLKEH
ncbi:H-type small acid-soluble spore protein [Bacillus songklensis]|uniref:Small, acid-soluble spore protein H n=1 Tax=Bacillus songklensis TaxID=1069116 RepID=A0ABV8B6T5_9BACI